VQYDKKGGGSIFPESDEIVFAQTRDLHRSGVESYVDDTKISKCAMLRGREGGRRSRLTRKQLTPASIGRASYLILFIQVLFNYKKTGGGQLWFSNTTTMNLRGILAIYGNSIKSENSGRVTTDCRFVVG
jgi:hypothetical protein